METLFSLINSGACGLVSMALIGAVLHPKVHDGIVIKVGLICMALGFGAIALLLYEGVMPRTLVGMEHALMLVNAGIAVVILGYVWRKSKVHHPVRRATDWADPMETRPMQSDHL